MTSLRLRVGAAAILAMVSFASPPTGAHHSAAMFDDSRTVELKGVVKELQWTNPHVWLQVTVNDNGTRKEWSIEAGSPNTLSRNGWRSSSFTPGDEVTVRVNPMKDGSAAGNFIGAKFQADGRTIGRWN
jgi:hypothetical protein